MNISGDGKRLMQLLVHCLFGLLFFILTLVIINWTVSFVTWATLDSGWAQAAGAMIGIGIAIWVPAKQRADSERAGRERQVVEQRRVCEAIIDELTLLQTRFTGPNVIEILRDVPDEIFDVELPIPVQRFPVFGAMVGRLTMIDSAELRRGIIEAYDHATSVIDVAALNNRRLHSFVEVRRSNSLDEKDAHADELEFQLVELRKLRRSMRGIVCSSVEKVNALLPKLQAHVDGLNANLPTTLAEPRVE